MFARLDRTSFWSFKATHLDSRLKKSCLHGKAVLLGYENKDPSKNSSSTRRRDSLKCEGGNDRGTISIGGRRHKSRLSKEKAKIIDYSKRVVQFNEKQAAGAILRSSKVGIWSAQRNRIGIITLIRGI